MKSLCPVSDWTAAEREYLRVEVRGCEWCEEREYLRVEVRGCEWCEEREYLRVEVPRLGRKTPFRGRPFQEVAKKVVSIAKGGLDRRGYDEVSFLNRIEVIAETGKSQADLLLVLYETKWQRSVDPLYNEFMY
ncbi:hypothetical protein CEUSTIGMA_g11375.t1 [Chlamydomonas eustigma]|uniref:Uncharacterized protein n=1 Tax=Chlamydomonas eustigma TaxID=1157962 RepID=A0A250XLH8_9CHLO|nr:hypothetical protein CEUSTIGMA_g11375.t1 [Chlamydomonas eustigma]|eukprot:GAX83951.1 hypothetical protein CEUSTIGMA_g11375.t1 [Chlamydomonas eustigma]